MFRKGYYAEIDGKEYRLGKEGVDWVNIVSYDQNDLKNGFQPHPLDASVLTKKVQKKDLNNILNIDTLAVYKNVRLSIGSEKDGMLLVGTSDAAIANQLGLERTDKYFYEKWIEKSEVTLVEEIEEVQL